MAEKSDIPRASASLRSITPMVRITSGPGVDPAPVKAWTCVMLVPPRKEEDRAAAPWITPCSRVPRPESILTQEVRSTMGSRNTWTHASAGFAMLDACSSRLRIAFKHSPDCSFCGFRRHGVPRCCATTHARLTREVEWIPQWKGDGPAVVIPFARPGALAKAVFVAIACEEAITLCGLRKLVSTVSCCSALKARNAAGRTQSWRQLHFDHYHFALYHFVLC